ncbi:MAG: ATP-binding cassette domain-containing protein [Ignavibacteriales bacterium]|nr:ATP-binding cassette domain-containing protein [Ignavibacteriales bacterium]
MLKAINLRKEFTNVIAVDNVSLEAQRGEILGLLGPNGAGKTTTIRMILNILQPDSGTITFDGNPFDESIRNLLGYLPEERGLYRKNKLLNTILYFASLKGIDAAEGKRRAYKWLERFDLLNKYQSKIEELSKGNQQKVQFIISILHDPELVILDEPFSGLDPVNQILLKDILLELKQQGRAVIFSTHQMEQAEKLCDKICLINKGSVVLDGELSEVKSRYGKNSIHIEYDGDGSFLKDLPFIQQATVYQNYAELVLKNSISTKEILSVVSDKLDVRKFEYVEPSLNSIFIEVVGLPDKNEEPIVLSVPTKPQQPSIFQNKRVKRELISVIIFGSVSLAAFIASFFVKSLSLTTAGIFFLGTIASFIKFLYVRKKALIEMKNREKEERADAR